MKLTWIDFISTYPEHYDRHWQLAAAEAGSTVSDSRCRPLTVKSDGRVFKKLFIPIMW